MNKLLLSVHVVAAIVFVGPITVATSLFPRYARGALAEKAGGQPAPAARLLHRVTRVYTALAVSVPAVGIILAARMGVLTNVWVIVSLVVTGVAAALLVAVVVPAQVALMARVDGTGGGPAPDLRTELRRLSLASGTFALLWVVVTVLMIVRPGSTTGL